MSLIVKEAEQRKKPPLGLKTKWLVDEQRLEEINEAIIRYVRSEQKLAIPVEWIEERNEIIERQKNRVSHRTVIAINPILDHMNEKEKSEYLESCEKAFKEALTVNKVFRPY